MPSAEAFRVTAIIAAYNEADVIAQGVGDFIHQGVHVYLIDHSSTDGTAAAVAHFLGRGLARIERFPEESGFPVEDAGRFAWESILRRKEILSRELDSDWFIHSDADEFRESPWPERTLRDAIHAVDRLGYDAIDFALLNFRPTHDGFRPGDDVRAAFPYYEPAGAFDRLQIKAWKNTRAPVDLVTEGTIPKPSAWTSSSITAPSKISKPTPPAWNTSSTSPAPPWPKCKQNEREAARAPQPTWGPV